MSKQAITDGVHVRDARSGGELTMSETVKTLKPALLVHVTSASSLKPDIGPQ